MGITTGYVCPLTWDDLDPVADRRRFCNGCRKVVYDLSDCGEAEVRALLVAHGGRICGRYRADALGRPLFGVSVAAALLTGGAAGADPGTAPCTRSEAAASASANQATESGTAVSTTSIEPVMLGDIAWDPEDEARYVADIANRAKTAPSGS